MSQTIYLRDPQSGALTEFTDPKAADLVPLLAKGFKQVFEKESSVESPGENPEEKKEI